MTGQMCDDFGYVVSNIDAKLDALPDEE